MRHAQECDVSDFSGHSVRSLPNRNWFHVIRFYSLFDQVFRHSQQCQAHCVKCFVSNFPRAL